MPMIPVQVETSTVAITSVVSAAIAFGACRAMDLKPGISLAIAVGVGIVLFSIGIIPIGLLAVVAIGIGITLFKVMIKGSTPESTNGAGVSAAIDQPSAGPLLATLMKDVALNSPDPSQLQSIVSVCPQLTETDLARLRVCITVAQSALFLWYFEKLRKAVGSDFDSRFSAAVSDALSSTPLEVAVEDYIPSRQERDEYLSKNAEAKETASGKHLVRIVDLLLGLLSMRKAAYFEAIASDMSPNPLPFLSAGQLTVRGFVGKDHTEYSHGGPLATMIGAYLASMLTSIHKTLAGSAA